MKNALAGIAVVVIIVVITVGGYLGGWWLQEDSVNRQTTIDRQSTAFVTSRIEKIRDDIVELESLSDSPQKANITKSVCAAFYDIEVTSIVPTDVATFAARNC